LGQTRFANELMAQANFYLPLIQPLAYLRAANTSPSERESMTFDPDQSTRELRENGLTSIPAAFNADECVGFVRKLNDLAICYDHNGLTDLGGDSRSVVNFFRHDDDLMPLVFNP
jgi:hypothetical protein